jgi:hypothetical protein
LLRHGGILLAGLLVGAVVTFHGAILASLFPLAFGYSASYVPGGLVVLALAIVTRYLVRGRPWHAVAAALLWAIVVVAIIAILGGPAKAALTAQAVSPLGVKGPLKISFSADGISVFGLIVLLVMVAYVGAALIIAIGGGGVAILALSVSAVLAGPTKNVPLALSIGGLMICQGLAAYSVHDQALRGDLRFQWVRDLIIWLYSRGGTQFAGTDLAGASFTGACLRGANFCGAKLYHTCLQGADDLHWALFDPRALRRLPVQQLLSSGEATGEDFSSLSLRGAYLRGACLQGASLRFADLQDADLRGAKLADADLTQADLRGANLGGVMLEGAKSLAGARVDALTYERSGWDPAQLEALVALGVCWDLEKPTGPGRDRINGPPKRSVVILSAPEDNCLVQEFVGHLGPMEREGLVSAFHIGSIPPGAAIDKEIVAHLDTADVVVVLVSPPIFDKELWHNFVVPALARQESGATVIPLLARPVDWSKSELAKLEPLPKDRRPVTMWPNRDEAWAVAASELRLTLEKVEQRS